MVDAQVSIPDFNLSGKTAFYNINITYGSQSWKMQKRYSDFLTLYNELAPTIKCFPELPPKGYLYLDKQTHYEDRKIKLEKFLFQCCSRTDIATSVPFCKFMQFDVYIKTDSIMVKPFSLPKFNVNFTMSVTQSIALGDKLITVENVMEIADLAIESIKRKNLSQIKLWSLGNLSITHIWTIPCPYRTGHVEIFDDLMYIGNSKGELKAYTIKDPPKLVNTYQPHYSNIRGIVQVDDAILTIAEDGKLATTKQGKDPSNITISDKALTNIIYESSQKRVFVSDGQGNVVLYSVATLPPVKLECVPTNLKTFIRCMVVDFDEMLIFILTDEGLLKGFKYDNNSSHPKFMEFLIVDFQESVRSIYLLKKLSILIIGNQKGIARFFSYKANKILYNIPAHKSSIKSICCNNNNEIMFSSKDKTMSRWVIPESWKDVVKENIEPPKVVMESTMFPIEEKPEEDFKSS